MNELTGFYIVGAIVLLVLTLVGFMASWNERQFSKGKNEPYVNLSPISPWIIKI